jgi:hypothetical protein
MSLNGIDNLSYLTYGAIGLTGIILAVATAYDRGDGDTTPTESAPLFTEPIIPALPSFSSESSNTDGPGPLAELLGTNEPKKEDSILPDVFGTSEPKKEDSILPDVFGTNEPKKEPSILPAIGGKKKKRRTKKSKSGKKHRKTKHKQTK